MYYNFTPSFVQRVLQSYLLAANLDFSKPDEAVKSAEKKLRAMRVYDFSVTINRHYSGADETWLDCAVRIKVDDPFAHLLIILRKP